MMFLFVGRGEGTRLSEKYNLNNPTPVELFSARAIGPIARKGALYLFLSPWQEVFLQLLEELEKFGVECYQVILLDSDNQKKTSKEEKITSERT